MEFFIGLPIFWLMFILHLQLGNIRTNSINTSDEFNPTIFQKRYHDEYNVKRVYEFQSGKYNYYLTTQLSSNVEGSPYISKIIRIQICNDNDSDSDISWHGYIEIPIVCEFDDDSPYNLVQAAHVGKPAAMLQSFLEIVPNDDVLFAVFSKSENINLSSNKPRNASALCMYTLKNINEKFDKNIQNCFNGNGHRGFGSMLTNRSCQKVNQNITLNFCKSTVNIPLDGNTGIKNAPFYWEESLFTSIFTNLSGNFNDVFIATNTSRVMKIIQNMWGHPTCKDFELTVNDTHTLPFKFNYQRSTHSLSVYSLEGPLPTITNVPLHSLEICSHYKDSTKCKNTKKCLWKEHLNHFDNCVTSCQSSKIRVPDADDEPLIHWGTIEEISSNTFQIDRFETLHLRISSNTFQIDRFETLNLSLSKLTRSNNLYCRFTFNESSLTTDLIVEGTNNWEDKYNAYCSTPEANRIPRIPNNMDYLNAKLNIGKYSWYSMTRINIKFFDCKIHTTYKSCVYSTSPCQWNFLERKCQRVSKKIALENDGTCPDSSPPSITNFRPQIGPWEGGTNITIQGNNLGCNFENTGQNIKVAGVDCTPYKEMCKTNELITCVINKSKSFQYSEGPVELYINGTHIKSTQDFKFVDFEITDISPKQAYKYGGVKLTITGENLDAGRSIEVSIGNTLCIMFLRSLSTIQCFSGPSSSTDKENKVVVKIDENNRTLPNDTFKYVKDQKRDDEGFNIIPKGIPAGGVKILIRMVDSQSIMNSIKKLLLNIHDGNRIYSSSCEIRNDSTTSKTWICLSPIIPHYDSSSIDAKKPREMNISFSEDANSSKICFENQPHKFLLYPNPKFEYFLNTSIQFGSNSFVIIQGHNIDKACQISDIKVNVGSYDCEIISINSNQVICSLPTLPSLDSDTEYDEKYDILAEHDYIIVSIGADFNVSVFRPNQSQYTSTSEIKLYIIYGVAIFIPVILLMIGFHIISRKKTIKKYSHRERKAEREIAMMSMQAIAVKQCIKRVIVKNAITLDEYSSQILKFPTVEIEYTSVPKNRTGTSAESEYIIPIDNEWEFPKSNLMLGGCLGEGEFGKVLKGQAKNILEENITTTVAVKMLKDNHSDEDMICLVSEMEIMKMIGTHVNVLRLLGCCTQDGALFVITEYVQYGNLREFLRGYLSPDGEITAISLSQETLIMFAVQVAEGMEYLAFINCIHRDLAARNILVTDDYIAKIADFGLSRDITNKEYYKKTTNGRMPVKWMAPESLCHNIYSTQSDVWSYGVLLWEIFTMGGVPYPSLVHLENLYQVLCSGYRMEKPLDCSVKMYCLMYECWSFHPTDRPTFSTIVKKLQDEHTVNPKK